MPHLLEHPDEMRAHVPAVCGNGWKLVRRVKAGEFIFYPRDYWHQTQNLEHHTMSLSGSVVDAYNWETSIREFDTECTAGRIMHPQEGDGVCDGLRTCFDLWEEKFTKPGATKELKR